MPELFHQRSDWNATLAAAAEALDLDVVAVEKDFWVCQVLRGLASGAHRNDVVFKGGTSLEKMRLTQRFSEDIDALVVIPDTVKASGPKPHRNYLKKVAATAIVPGIQPDDNPVGRGNPGTYWRHVHLHYREPITGSSGLIDTGRILLELGESGGPTPNLQHEVTSLLGRQLAAADVDLAQYADLQPFAMTFLHPGRTLLEKLLRVEAYVTAPEAAKDGEGTRIGRQLYDLWALLGDARVHDLLSDGKTVKEILDSAAAISKLFTSAPVRRPEGGFASSVAYDPDSALATQMQDWHEQAMRELYYGAEPAPTYLEVCERIRAHAHLL